jgi:glycosyltransferase involved in cell wall biosynthesis
LQSLSVGLYNNGQVHWHSAADTERVLASADIVWVPSLTSIGRQAALDAMSLGKPVVASDVSCLRELIRDGETGLLATSGDVVSLARRTHALVLDPALRTRLGQTAREEVRRRFALADAVHVWREAYSKVA